MTMLDHALQREKETVREEQLKNKRYLDDKIQYRKKGQPTVIISTHYYMYKNSG